MGNISTKINLGALKNATILKMGKNKDVDCIIIPIAQNHLYKTDKGAVYLDLIGFDVKPKEGSKDTHLVKQSLPKEVLDKLTDDEKKAYPILGNHINWANSTQSNTEVTATTVSSEDDLPF